MVTLRVSNLGHHLGECVGAVEALGKAQEVEMVGRCQESPVLLSEDARDLQAMYK